MKIFLSYILIFFATPLFAQPVMQGLSYGKLENGITYYIKHSGLQPGKVSIHLVQNVGAILEEDSENGLAHFLEHMAFNGTRHFSRGVMSYLKGKSIYSFNAHTGVNETVYSIDDLPVASAGLVDTCLLIVKDWCNDILLKDTDINEERGVIIEEWRSRNTSESKIMTAAAPYIYNHSKFAQRDVIGDMRLLETFHPDTLRAFYHKWYRPDLQCIIIVGDIDQEKFETKVRELFGTIPAVTDPLPRYDITIADHTDPFYKLILEPENKTRTITIHQRIPRPSYTDDAARRKYGEAARLFNALWRQRISRLKNANAEQFLAADIDFGNLVKGYNSFSMDIMPFDRQDKKALSQIWSIWEEIRRYGFTDAEIEEMQENELQELAELEKRIRENRNDYYTDLFKNHYLNGIPCPDLQEEIEKSRETILEFTPDDMRRWITSWANDRNQTILITGNDAEYPYLTQKEVLAVTDSIRQSDIQQTETAKEAPVFFDLSVQPGEITKTEKIKRFGAEIWTLSNGARVVYKNVPEGFGSFLMACSSPGGQSVAAAEDLPSLTAMQALALKSGLYKHDRNTLMDLMNGKQFNINLMLNEYSQSIGGMAGTENAEMFFQFLYLMFEHPRFDREQFDKYVQRLRYLYETKVKTPLDRVHDTIRALTNRKDERNREFDLSYISDMDFGKMEKLYRTYFDNARQFTFCITGDIDREEAQRLSCTYIGSLPARKAKKNKVIVRDYTIKHDSLIREYTADMPDNRGIVEISFTNDQKFSKKEELAFSIYGMMLRNRFFELIREQEGGTYDVDVNTSYNGGPNKNASLNVNFLTKRDRTDDLKKIVYHQLNLTRQHMFAPEELQQIILMLKQNKAENDSRQDPGYWMNVLNFYIEYNTDITSPDNFENIIDEVTPETVRQLARKFFKNVRKQEIIIKSNPEESGQHWEHF